VGRDEQERRERDTLKRIVALLLALADLAEQASGRCRAVRWSVLWLLHPGLAVARDYVATLTQNADLAGQPLAIETGPGRDSADDAMQLAQAFRALAAALAALLSEGFGAWQTALDQCANLARFANGALLMLHDPMSDAERRDSS